jgi:hypothetical protein
VLVVPAPTLTQEGATSTRLSAAKPIAFACGPVSFPTGEPLELPQATEHGFRLLRDRGGGAEVWDEEAKVWRPGTAVTPGSQPLFVKDGIWQGILVATGQQDAGGAPKLLSDPVTDIPRYWVTCVFRGVDAAGVEHGGESPPSPTFEVLPAGAENLGGVALEPEEKPKEATRIRMFLADTPGHEVGRVVIARSGSGATVTLTAGGATVVLNAAGAIDLTPATGQRVTVNGNLHITGTLSTTNNSWT